MVRTLHCTIWYFSQLLVGSEDFDIRVFKEDEIIAEMTETEVSIIIVFQFLGLFSIFLLFQEKVIKLNNKYKNLKLLLVLSFKSSMCSGF